LICSLQLHSFIFPLLFFKNNLDIVYKIPTNFVKYFKHVYLLVGFLFSFDMHLACWFGFFYCMLELMWECKEGFNGCCLCKSNLACNGQDKKISRFDPSAGLSFLRTKSELQKILITTLFTQCLKCLSMHLEFSWKDCRSLYKWKHHLVNLSHLKKIKCHNHMLFWIFFRCHIFSYIYCMLPLVH
jgi:hypothetical protein